MVGNVSTALFIVPNDVGREWRRPLLPLSENRARRSSGARASPPASRGRFQPGARRGGQAPASRLRSRPGLAPSRAIFSTPPPGTDLIACTAGVGRRFKGKRLSAAASAIAPTVCVARCWPAATRPRGVFLGRLAGRCWLAGDGCHHHRSVSAVAPQIAVAGSMYQLAVIALDVDVLPQVCRHRGQPRAV